MTTSARYTVWDGEIIAEERGGVQRFYVPDPLGSTRALVDNNQTITDTFTYWPYGEVRSRTGTTPTPFQYVGTPGYYGDGASRVYVRARHLDTKKARWLTKDPLWSVRRAHAYLYSDDTPALTIDPSGFITERQQKQKIAIAEGCGFEATKQKNGHIKLRHKKTGKTCPPFPGIHGPGKDEGADKAALKCVQANCEPEDCPGAVRKFANCSDVQLGIMCVAVSACIVLCGPEGEVDGEIAIQEAVR